MIRLNIQQLETFISVAENLNFARAAEQLNITQSAVSRQIHALEDELGTKLLYRSTRVVALTSEGISFLEDARHIVNRLKFAEAKIKHHTNAQLQVLSIGCVNETYFDLLCEILDICRKKIPSFHPAMRILTHPALLPLFYQGEIDLMFGFREDILLHDDIIFRELCRVPLCCVLPDSHPLAEEQRIKAEDLWKEKLITCSSSLIHFKAVEFQNQLAQHLSPEAIHICENFSFILLLIRAGYGYSILPRSRSESEGLCYIPLKEAEPLSYGIFYRRGASDPLLKEVIAAAKSAAQEQNFLYSNSKAPV